MKRILLYWLVFTLTILYPLTTLCQNNTGLNIGTELSAADLGKDSIFNGHQLLIKMGKELNPKYGIEAGFSLSQSMNEVMSYDPKIVENPKKIRKAYNRSSFDVFSGINFNVLKKSNFSFPLGIGLSSRVRTESYPDPDADLDVELYSIDKDGKRRYAVITKTVYDRSLDFGLYGVLGIDYQIFNNWRVSLKGRYKLYAKGFSIFTTGIGAYYYF